MRIWLSSCMRSVGCELLLEARNVLLQFKGDKLAHFSVGKAVGGKQAPMGVTVRVHRIENRSPNLKTPERAPWRERKMNGLPRSLR